MIDDSTAAKPLRVIQFPHPGFEYSPGKLGPKGQRTGVMHWKREGTTHNRKYLVASGSYVDSPGAQRQDGVRLGFWGEWEAPSRWTRAEGSVKAEHPSAFHEPLLPARRPAGSHQNTDPLVFDDTFLYTNCKMGIAPLRGIPGGSLILFGRTAKVRKDDGEKDWAFALDTCFVVDHRHDPVEIVAEDPEPYGQDLLTDMVLAPLLSGTTSGRAGIHHYVSRPYTPDTTEPFSFFPAVLHDERPDGFARPVLEPTGILEGLINPRLAMSVRTTEFAEPDAIRAVWDCIVERVNAAGCGLGVRVEAPSRGYE